MPPAPIDESQQRRVEAEAESLQFKREKVSAACGQLISAALSLACELFRRADGASPPSETVDALSEKLSQCMDRDSQGRSQLIISLPDDAALKNLAATLARLLQA